MAVTDRPKIKFESVEELLGVPKVQGGTEIVKIRDIIPFKDHPFKVLDDDKMKELIASIQTNGVISPVIIRPRGEGGYEMISGHRRMHAAEKAGLDSIPAIVKDMTDDEAIITMVDSNFQRETTLPSEKAFAYRMRMEAMKRKAGKPPRSNSCQVGTNYRADAALAEEVTESARNIHRYIRLTLLCNPLLDMVDNQKLRFNVGVELSFLSCDEQDILMRVIEEDKVIPSLTQAVQLKKISQDKAFTKEAVHAVLTMSVIRNKQISIKREEVARYFEPETSDEEMVKIICTLLEDWKNKSIVNKYNK